MRILKLLKETKETDVSKVKQQLMELKQNNNPVLLDVVRKRDLRHSGFYSLGEVADAAKKLGQRFQGACEVEVHICDDSVNIFYILAA
jgi:hypothetical protein